MKHSIEFFLTRIVVSKISICFSVTLAVLTCNEKNICTDDDPIESVTEQIYPVTLEAYKGNFFNFHLPAVINSGWTFTTDGTTNLIISAGKGLFYDSDGTTIKKRLFGFREIGRAHV